MFYAKNNLRLTRINKRSIMIENYLIRTMAMNKIIFFDIDGTIVTETSPSFIPESTVSTIRKTRENGNLTFINTGRTAFNVSKRIKEIGFDGYLCGCGTYIEYAGEVLLYSTRSRRLSAQTRDIIRRCNAIPLYERRDTAFFDSESRTCDECERFRQSFAKKGVDVTQSIDVEEFNFDKFVIWTDDDTDINRLMDFLNNHFSVIDRGNGFFEIVPKEFSKATAIEMMLNELAIPYENAFAIGDSTNDLPMLKAVPNSIGMGAADAIKNDVSFVTKDIEDNGIEFALKHFKLI